jgi:hypothetical protein
MKARLGLALVVSAAFIAPAHAAWSPEPVTVYSTPVPCPLVAAAADGANGAYVVYQRSDAGHAVVAHHLLAAGDLDPIWPADGLALSGFSLNRVTLGAVGDGIGGAYVWWVDGTALYLTRMLPDATVAAGWPAHGKLLGYVFTADVGTPGHRPLVFADGQGGVWLGWLAGRTLASTGRVAHLGPGAVGAGGWPTSGRSFAVSETPEAGGRQTLAFTFAPAPDGGAWVAWGDAPYDETGYQAGSWRLLRVGATGYPLDGWTGEGTPVRALHGEWVTEAQPGYGPYPTQAPVAVASDGADGVYVLLTDVDEWSGATPRLFHLDAAGVPAASWPTAGVVPFASGYGALSGPAECSARLFREAAGGVFALRASFFSEGYVQLDLNRFTSTGTQVSWGHAGPEGFECIVPPVGDTWLADYWPYGCTGPYCSYPSLYVQQTLASGLQGPGFLEYHEAYFGTWYGDIGLAPTDDGGAIFAWSQQIGRTGVFARRFAPGGEVTGVPEIAPPATALRLRFAPGRGVIATPGRVAGGRLRLMDVAGRACAAADVPEGVHEITLEGTATLPSGMYFALHRGATGAIETGKVLVLR